jgi:hypothetical protein
MDVLYASFAGAKTGRNAHVLKYTTLSYSLSPHLKLN